MIEVYYTDLRTIDGNEGAKIVCNELVEKEKIELRAQEGSHIKIGMPTRREKRLLVYFQEFSLIQPLET